MKKAALTMITLALVVSGSAVVGGSNPDDDMAITSGGSSSASQGVSPEGTDYRSYFSVFNTTERNETGITDFSWNNDTVSFEGVYRTPTPCYQLNHDVERNGNSYNFDIISEEQGNGTCAQVVTYHRYEGNFTSDHAYQLNVTHGGEQVEMFEHPDLGEGSDPGFFGQLLGAILRLFA
jgi:hypothetical protein